MVEVVELKQYEFVRLSLGDVKGQKLEAWLSKASFWAQIFIGFFVHYFIVIV